MTMCDEARSVWAALRFRLPMLLRNLDGLSREQTLWRPAPITNPIAWNLWHIAEVEDNWPRRCVYDEPPRFPFGLAVREAMEDDQYPPLDRLREYLDEVRALTRQRLEAARPADFDRATHDVDFGPLTVRDVWAGVVTSFAWHAGQIAQLAKIVPGSPIRPMRFRYHEQERDPARRP